MGKFDTRTGAGNHPLNEATPAARLARTRRWVWWTYLALTHLLLILALFRHDLIERLERVVMGTPTVFAEYRGIVLGQVSQSRCLPEYCVVFLGDSITAALPVPAVVGGDGVNFGIDGDTTVGLLWRIPQYANLNTARAIVVSIGVNDMSRFGDDRIAANYRSILESLPSSVPVIVSGILPLREEAGKRSNISYLSGHAASNVRIKEFNRKLDALCRDFPNATMLDAHDAMADETGDLRQEYTSDGVHLTPEGYDAWVRALKSKLSEIPGRK
jgi:lysophospholipase L1-like esterase